MGFDQYHEPPDELPAETRTFARLCASLTEEAEAIGWYEQRLAIEPNPVARAVMANAVGEEFKHFSMDLEFLLRQKPEWREIAQGILFKEGDIVERGEAAEAAADEVGDPTRDPAPAGSASRGVGSLRGRDL
jgi:hypothetical protein